MMGELDNEKDKRIYTESIFQKTMIFEKLKYDAPELDKSVVFSRIF